MNSRDEAALVAFPVNQILPGWVTIKRWDYWSSAILGIGQSAECGLDQVGGATARDGSSSIIITICSCNYIHQYR